MAWSKTISEDATTQDTVNLIIDTINGYHDQEIVDQLLQKLPSPADIVAFTYALFRYLDHVIYELDPTGHEIVTTPQRLIINGKGDCKKMSVFIGAVLKRAGFIPFLKVVSYNAQEWAHIYVILPLTDGKYLTLDPVNYRQFDTEVDYQVSQVFSLDKESNMKLSQLGKIPGRPNGSYTWSESAKVIEGELGSMDGLGKGEWIKKAGKAIWGGLKWLWKNGGQNAAEEYAMSQLNRQITQSEMNALAQVSDWPPSRITKAQAHSEGVKLYVQGRPPIAPNSMVFVSGTSYYDGGHIVNRIWFPPNDPTSMRVVLPVQFIQDSTTYISAGGVFTNDYSSAFISPDEENEQAGRAIMEGRTVIEDAEVIDDGSVDVRPPPDSKKSGTGWILPTLGIAALFIAINSKK